LDAGQFDVIVNVVDATNLSGSLNLSLELLDYETPLVVAMNQYDRLRSSGTRIDIPSLTRALGVPVVSLSALKKEGIEALVRLLYEHRALHKPPSYAEFESNIQCFSATQTADPRSQVVRRLDQGVRISCDMMPEKCKSHTRCSDVGDKMQAMRRSRAHQVARDSLQKRQPRRYAHRSVFDTPLGAGVSLLLTLWVCIRGIAWAIDLAERVLRSAFSPIEWWLGGLLRLMLGGTPSVEVISRALAEGLIVPFGSVLPAMISVYLLMALLEDSGILARFCVMLDSLTQPFRLSGQCMIPIALGFGCRSPAVLSARVLRNAAERTVVVTLVSIAVPCAATLGIVSGVVEKLGASAFVIAVSVACVFTLLAALLGRLINPNPEPLVLEIPPIRRPSVENVLTKSWTRMCGFFRHVLPALVALNVAVRLLLEAGLLNIPQHITALTQKALGVRGEVLIGIATTAVQRYLAPVVLLNLDLLPREATIACVMVCLSWPCAPVAVLCQREIGFGRTLLIFALGTALPLLAAVLLNTMLP